MYSRKMIHYTQTAEIIIIRKPVKLKYGLLWKHETNSVEKLHSFSAF